MNLSLLDPFALAQEYPESQSITVRYGHSGCIKFNPTGDYLASGLQDGSIAIFDIDTNGVLLVLRGGHSRSIQSLSWSHDSRYLLSGSQDWKCIVWDLATSGQKKRVFNFETPVWMAMFQPFTSDKFVVSLFEDYSRYIDMSAPGDNGSKYREVKLGSDPENGKAEYALSCTFNRTGEYIILGTSKGNLHVLRTGHSKVVSSTRISSANIKNMVISTNGKCLVLNSSDRVVRFVTIPEILFGKHQELSDERRKANGYEDNKELVDEKYKENGQINGGDVADDNKSSQNGDDGSAEKDQKSTDKKSDAEKSGDDNESDEEDDDLWKFEVVHKFQDVVNKLQWNSVAISPNTEYVLASTYEAAHDIYMWETSMGSLVKIYEGPKEELVDVEWHPTRSVIAATGLDSGRIYVWTSITPQRWSALAPDFIEVEQNVNYQEREDEFDVEDENEQNQRLLEDEDQEVDIVSGDPVKNVFSIPVSLDLDEDEDDFSSD
ncbi:hypothetical protein DV495_002427 [Geotrichum candidum]|nr:hypothetical protein DV454_004482 [Geotrichum candidum]KAF5129265.1 hypothetical protein DV495_002427 [Geotrichum candidum]